MDSQKHSLAGDLLYGAGAIAEYVFGDREERRRVYTLDAAGVLPTFKFGGKLCARRSKVAAAIEALEAPASDQEAR